MSHMQIESRIGRCFFFYLTNYKIFLFILLLVSCHKKKLLLLLSSKFQMLTVIKRAGYVIKFNEPAIQQKIKQKQV